MNRVERFLQKLFIRCQKHVNYSHRQAISIIEVKKGTNWASVTDSFVEYLLTNEKAILSTMQYAKSPDEHYKQVLAFNSNFRNKIYSIEDEFEGCMRLIDWNRGKPYNWQLKDLNEILSSNKLFARKFTENNKALINEIVAHVAKG